MPACPRAAARSSIAVEKDPNNRYQRGGEMAKDIRAVIAKSAGAGA